jgi:hypothetical protein
LPVIPSIPSNSNLSFSSTFEHDLTKLCRKTPQD